MNNNRFLQTGKTETRTFITSYKRTTDTSHRCNKRRAYIGTYGEESIFYWIFQGCRPQAFQTTSYALPVTWDSGAFYWIAFAGSRKRALKVTMVKIVSHNF
ncbi:uncharacterized protein LOC112603339 [Melanaphis sacchari]|uniref:uncharacterized protein LOC112603339 n=1 Tax=Melanaphis sacchari TaxID=742174 RepID=UPI000DC1418A|nr:uncharacterized protein LOC112603339 [Melanaphis sacchari]